MMRFSARDTGLIIVVATAICATAVICIIAAVGNSATVNFECAYYFVCYRMTDNSVSASSLSDTVSSYGGAAYILEHSGNYYITVSCYYSENDAETVCNSLKRRELDCFVLEVTTDEYPLKGGKKNRQLYLGNLNTLNSLSRIAYECANGLDTGTISQGNAKEIISSVKSGLYGLSESNGLNCFSSDIGRLITECDYRADGFIRSKDLRYLQIMLADCVIKAELY